MSRTIVARPLSALACAFAVSVALSGCSANAGAPATEETAPSEQSPAPEVPWEEGTGPVAAIEFEFDGTATTLIGTFEQGGLLSCSGDLATIANTSPAPGLGATFATDGGPDVFTWVVGDDLVAQFSGEGSVQAEEGADGSTTYTVAGAEGRASVLPHDPAASAIGDYDMSGAPQVDAISSFTVTCPPA